MARYTVPAALAAMVGAWLLSLFAGISPLFVYHLGTRPHEVTAVKLVIAIVIIFFALFDLLPRLNQLAFDPKYMILGGTLSGFFGGLSGNQGALRSAFLIKAGLEKKAFVGTGVIAAVVVDVARLLVYGLVFYTGTFAVIEAGSVGLIVAATLAAFVDSFIGRRLLKKVTLRTVQKIAGIMLILLGMGIGAGLI